MSEYNFSTLNDKDFEVLVRDLLTQELTISFQSFKVGKDKGIDLRYSTNANENEIIVQVKHYLKSGYNPLINTLKNDEKSKIDKLNPKRYILATSIGLSPAEKDKIKKLLAPYILNTNDIYGCDDLNSLITKFSGIEKKHYKLWFSNVNIIQKIVNNGIEGRSTFIEDKIRKNTGLYVVTKSFDEGLEILRKHKVLLITGTPGVGKTTLANLITYQLLSLDYRLIYIDEKIREAEDLFDNDTNIKQLFYFDDFLGSNYLEIINSRNTDKSIVSFIERVKSTQNKYLILTTRSTILNQAKSNYEKLSRANLNTLKYEIEITKYKDIDKANILYNHLYFNDLSEEMIKEIFNNKNYWKIIKHPNYNPRLIEFFTNEQNISHLKPIEYFDFIISHLNNPNEIWNSAFINQLNEEEKYLLFTILSLGRRISKNILELAFDDRIEHEVLKYGFTRKVNIFNISFKNLLDGYITNSIDPNNRNFSHIDFVNPSLRDYLISFFNKYNLEKWRMIESFTYIEQFLIVFSKKGDEKNIIEIGISEIRKFLEIANSKRLKSIYFNDSESINIRTLSLFNKYRNGENKELIDRFILGRLQDIKWNSLRSFFFHDLLPILEDAIKNSDLYLYFNNNWDIIIEKLIEKVDSEHRMSQIKHLFEKYNLLFNDYKHEDEEWIEKVTTTINRIYENEAVDIINEEENDVYSLDDFDKLKSKVNERFVELCSEYLNEFDIIPRCNVFSDIDPQEIITKNEKANEYAEAHQDDWPDNLFENEDNESKIDDLFSYFEKN